MMTSLLQKLRRYLKKFRSTGMRGERAAAKFLKQNRFKILGRNLHTQSGEVDILAMAPDQKTVVVVEVKSSGRQDGIPPEVRVNADKKRRLIALAAQLQRRYNLQHRPWRFDVISVRFSATKPPVIRHYPAAFTTV